MPPTAESITEDTDKALPPHNSGIYAPAVEPMVRKIQMRDFELIRYLRAANSCASAVATWSFS